ncbi:BTAD domain-containing putative transcriptional regulator [Micromonospora echinospora]|uniref:BTAD domain-containing putative transcriptional regulator n=1 Tax=Micromonospora echinospora TaxID=1877 RepID=UPI00340B00F5
MSGMLRFEILGPQRAWYADSEIDLGPGKQRAVLAVLLLAANRAVPTGQIVDAVWPEEPPANGTNVVQKYVAGLRRVLEPERSPRSPGQVLTLTDAGYLLRVDPDAVDFVRFERGVRRARRSVAEGRPSTALAELRAALDLWRGEPLSGFAGPSFEAARQRLVELRAAALEDRIGLELNAGRHREIVGELVELVVEFPVRERLRHQLMLALYRSGRQAEALSAYREIGDLLREEHGIEPGGALQELHGRILRSDPTLAPSPSMPPAAPAPAPAVLPPSAVPATAPAPAAAPALVPTPAPAPSPGDPSSSSARPALAEPLLTARPVPASSAATVVSIPAGTPPFAPGYPVTPAPSVPGFGAHGPAVPGYGGRPTLPLLPPLSSSGANPRRSRQPLPRWLSTTATIAGTALTVLSFGCLTWLVILAYAIWRRSWRLGVAAIGYLALSVVAIYLLEEPEASTSDAEALAFVGVSAVCGLVGAVHVVLLSRGVWAALTGTSAGSRVADDERRIRREQARYLLYHYPAARHELRIGRPDLAREHDDGGLVDINAVADRVIAGLPGVTVAQAQQISTDRWLRGPFSSMEELAGRCLLPPALTDSLRDVLVFLPLADRSARH